MKAFSSLLLLAGVTLSVAQAPVTSVTAVAGDGVINVGFVSSDVNAVSFEVTTTPTRFYFAPLPSNLFGSPTGVNGMVATGAADTVLDTTRYTTYLPTLVNPCPWPYTTTSLCLSSIATITTAARLTTIIAYHGAVMGMSAFFASGYASTQPSALGGVPVIQPNFLFPTNTSSRFEATITGFPITYDWNRISWSGVLLYHNDAFGRPRPFFKTGMYEYLGYFGSWYVRCTSTTSCTWTVLGATWTIGGSVTTAPTSSAPWKYGITRDPIARTWTPYHTHPTFGVWATGTALADANLPSYGSLYWTNYLNNTAFGLFDVTQVRVGIFIESQSNNGNSWGYTLERMILSEILTVGSSPPRLLWGTQSGADGICANGAADTLLDSTRFSFLPLPLPAAGNYCPLSALGSACITNAPTASVTARVARIRGFLNAQMNIAAFFLANGGVGVPVSTTPSMQNGAPILETNLGSSIPNNETTRISMVVTGFTDVYNWDRFSWSGLMAYDYDNAVPARIRPIWKTGLYEYLGTLAFYYPFCANTAPTSCSWTQLGSTFSIGGSVTQSPTDVAPWIYSVDRDPIAGTWSPSHTHPVNGQWTTNQPVFADSSFPTLMQAYWTNYLNNPTYGLFDIANVKIGAFQESQSGGPWIGTAMGMLIRHFSITTTIEPYIASLKIQETGLVAAAISSGSQCAYMTPTVVTVSRASVCTGNNCVVVAPASTQGVTHSVSVTSLTAALARSTAVTAGSTPIPAPTLPIAGAQLFLDANSMSTYAGGIARTCTINAALPCQPTLFWNDQAGGYMFGQAPVAASRPQLKLWTPSSPFQSLAFDGIDDRLQLDRVQLARDSEFDLMFPDQPNYIATRDAQTTWFMLYQPSEATVLSGTRTVFGRGLPAGAGGSSYIWYQQRATPNPVGQFSTYDQQQGFVVSSSPAGVGAVIAQRYRKASSSFLPNPHAQNPTLVTVMHYRNSSGGVLSSRAYRVDACEGIETGNFLNDRCSYGNGLSPADNWESFGPMGTNIARQALPASVPLGSNIVDYDYAGSPIQSLNFPKASGIFGIGTTFDGGSTPISSYFRGQLMALVMYRKSLTQTERATVQQYLLARYNQLCPAFAAPAGATSGCGATASGFSCVVTCDAAASPPRARVGGSSLLSCSNGAWVGKLPVCAATCAPRSSPRDYSTCTQTYGSYAFTDSTAFPVNSKFSDIAQFDALTPVGAPWSLLNQAWNVATPAGFSTGMLVGTPVVTKGCDPSATGSLILSENQPTYLDKLSAGQIRVVTARLRLMSDGTQAGIATRITSGRNAYMVVIGTTTTGANNYMALQKLTAGVLSTLTVTPLGTATIPYWDLTGSAAASAVTLRFTAVAVSATILSQVLTVEIVSGSTATTILQFTDSVSPLTVGSAGIVVNSGSAGFESLQVTGDCDSSGAMCNLYAGQSCSWTCSNGTVPGVGGVRFFGTNYLETCTAAGAMPSGANQFSCLPIPPIVSDANFTIREDAPLGTVMGTVIAKAVSPKHVPLFNIFSSNNNTETIRDKFSVSQGVVSDVFGVGSCSGDFVLRQGGTISFDRGKRFYTIIVTACTNGVLSACANLTVTVNVLNVPSAPFFLRDPDTNNDSPWIRAVAENSLVGAALFNPLGSAIGSNVTATSPEASPLLYDIAFGNSAGIFFINPTTGQLFVSSASVDFEVTNQYGIVVRATDTRFPTLSEQLQVQINVLDRNDPPLAVATQYISIKEDVASTGSLVGFISFTDQDIVDIWDATWVGAPPAALALNLTGQRVDFTLQQTLSYPPPETSPVFVWQGQTVREVIKGRVVIRDSASASVTVDVECGILAAWTPGQDPVANAVVVPANGLPTSGASKISIYGSYFNTIKTTYGSRLDATIVSQRDDAYPDRVYNCTGCIVKDDSTIECTSPSGWGSNLVMQLTYGSTRRNMASVSPLIVSYRLPVISSIKGSETFTTDLSLGNTGSLSTAGNDLLVLTASDLGLVGDAPNIFKLEFGMPTGAADGTLEYLAKYEACPAYEVWATPTNPGGFDGVNSRICVRMPAGIGRTHTYRIRVGTQVSNTTVYSALNNFWFVSYKAPTLSRVWRPINAAGDAPSTWIGTQNAGAVSSLGLPTDLIYFNGTNFGPMNKMPMVTLFTNLIVTYTEGVLGTSQFNYTVGLNVDGTPNCWKPDSAKATSLMACQTPPGVGSVVRVRLQVGNQAVSGTIYQAYAYPAPNMTGTGSGVSGVGAKNGDTAGGQEIIVAGNNFGPILSRYTTAITNTYQSATTLNLLSPATIPISITYGPTTGSEYIARGCVITSESPSQITCNTAPGVGRDFIYRMNIAGRAAVSPRMIGTGYAPPLLSSVTRLASEVTFDPILGAVPGPKDFSTSGNESIVINGKNFGPCPVGSAAFPPCSMDINPAYFTAQYYVTLDDTTTDYGATLGDTMKQIWYNATNCQMTVLHSQIVCSTAMGAGTNAVVRVTIAGQSSVLPTTSYAKPDITTLSLRAADLVTGIAAASPDGGDVVVITGTNFGPRLAGTCVNLGGTIGTRCRGMIQSITFGPTGYEHPVTDWDIPAAASTTHTTIHAYLPAGVGLNQRVVVTIADQISAVSPTSFSFASPIITNIAPVTGPTDPAPLMPVTVTVTGSYFGILSASTSISVLFGNPEDRTLVQDVPIVRVYPDPKDPSQVAAYLATAAPRQESVSFHLPSGLGADRAVRISLLDKRDGGSASPIISAPVFFTYSSPSISTIVVESLQQFIENNASLGFTPEYAAANSGFSASALPQVRRVSILGTNFGRDAFGQLSRNIEFGDTMYSNASDPGLTWSTAIAGSDMIPFSWSTTKIVTLTTLGSAWIRVWIEAQMFSPPTNPVTGLPDPVYLRTTSEAYRFDDLSPAIGNLVGTPGPFATAGGDILSFTVRNMVSVATGVTVTIDGALCPLVYGPLDTFHGAYTDVLAANVKDHLIMNSQNQFAYYDTPSPSIDSTWTLYCRMPPGEGATARLVVARDNVLSGELSVSYFPPQISTISVYDNITSTWNSVTMLPGNTRVVIPTLGTAVMVTGTNFGVCPGVLAGYQTVSMDVGLCYQTRIVQAGSTGSHTQVSFVVPEGEGSGMTFSVVAGGQSSVDAQRIVFEYAAPTITSVTSSGRTAGGDRINITGTNFGVNPPAISIGGVPCYNSDRIFGVEGHSNIFCTLSEGSGKNLDVIITVGGTQSVTGIALFSYLPPVVNQVIVQVIPAPGVAAPAPVVYDFLSNVTSFASGDDVGGYQVTLLGDNFGINVSPFDYTVHCLFVSWRGRGVGRSFLCNRRDDFIGEGEIPRIALEYFQDASGQVPWSHTSISFLFPPGVGVRDIIPWINGQGPITPPVFRYNAPRIDSELDPNHGPTAGGTKLNIVGSGFGIPAMSTADVNGQNSVLNLPVALSIPEYLSRSVAPQGALAIRFGRGCVTNYLTATGQVPAYLTACDVNKIASQTPTSLDFESAGGIGVNRSVSVAVYDVQPSAADPLVSEVVIIESNTVLFTYDPPAILLSRPRPVTSDGVSDSTFSVVGVNFGSLAQSNQQQWSDAEKAVNMTVGGLYNVKSAVRKVVGDASLTKIDQIDVTIGPLPVGYHNLSYVVAGQPGFTSAVNASRAALLVGCEAGILSTYAVSDFGPHGGYFGHPGETCLPCPAGAVCFGFDSRRGSRTAVDPGQHMYPVPIQGFFNLNTTDDMYDQACPPEVQSLFPGRPDVCIVRCEPVDACLGDNICAPQYRSVAPYFRCASCAEGFYKRATECIKCPDSPWALVIGFAMLVIVGGGMAYYLNRININIAYVAIAIDYFQVLAIFAMARVAWPVAIQELFHVLSAFNLNIEIVAPECIVPNLGFQRKWGFVMALPVSLQVFFGIVTLGSAAYKAFIKGQKVKVTQLGGSMMASVLMVMYLLYIYLTRNILDVFNCKPTDPPDGKTYLTVVFEECGKPGGVQMALLPGAVVALLAYVIGYPVGVAYLLWKNRETVMEDQLLRAKGVGNDRLTNPHAYHFRKRWGRLYYQFKPDAIFWVLMIILRKFCIAATFILFNKQPSFQMAATFLIMFLSYSAQMRFYPYMSPSDFDAVLKDHERQSLSDATHARLRATLSGISTRTRKTTRRNIISADGTVDSAALLGVLRGWLFNYNTVEQLMLFSAGIVAMMGLMFAAQARKSAYYKESIDAVTSVVIIVVAVSIVYLFSVFVTEVVVLTGESNRRKAAARSEMTGSKVGGGASGSKKIGNASGKKTLTDGNANEEDIVAEETFSAGDIDATTNPMFMGAKSAASSSSSSAADSLVNVEDASSVIENMREPPASTELWAIYKAMFEELASTVDTLRNQVDSGKAAISAASGESDDTNTPRSGAGASRKSRPVNDDDDNTNSGATPKSNKRGDFEPSPTPGGGLETKNLLAKGSKSKASFTG